jgi:hypothetical protein
LEIVTSVPTVAMSLDDITTQELIGHGSGGVVHKATWDSPSQGQRVLALKSINALDDDKRRQLVCRCLPHTNMIRLNRMHADLLFPQI